MSNNTKGQNIVSKMVSDVLSTETTIGDLNGKWAVMLKIAVLSITAVSPLIFAWAIWITSNTFTTQSHINSVQDFRGRIEKMEKDLAVTPEKVDRNSRALQQVNDEVKDVNKSNAQDHQIIMVELGKITTKLEIIEKHTNEKHVNQ